MDFFDQQERARKQSKLLKWYFALAVVAKIIAVCFVFGTAIQFARGLPLDFWNTNPLLLFFIAASAALSIYFGSLFQIRKLRRQGGKAIAELLGGRRVDSAPNNPDDLKLRRVVEEMAIAAGVSVPEIYLLDDETGINSFAAGFTLNDTVIGATRGAVQLLNRAELQGVMAHEFSHILNGDTRLNMELIGLAHGLLWPAIVGRVLVHGDCAPSIIDDRSVFDEDTVERLPRILLGYPMTWLGFLGLPFVRAVKSALCRERELLADAAAVQFTRYPDGIAGALKKVGGLYRRGRLDTPHAETASHLYFVTCHMELFITMLATHPPLGKRIRAIDPNFDGHFTRVSPLQFVQPERERETEAAEGSEPATATAEQLVGGAGNITVEGLCLAASMRAALPQSIQAAATSPVGAMAIIYALLINSEEAIRVKQLAALQANANPESYREVLKLTPDVQQLEDRLRMPAVDFAVPALRGLEPEAHDQFLRCVENLIEADNSIELFEYTVRKILLRRLSGHREGAPRVRIEFESEKPMLPECAILLSALARLDRDEQGTPEAAFACGARALNFRDGELALLSSDQCSLLQVDTALNTLVRASPATKRRILLACGYTVAADNKVEVRETELLRAIADTLDCPIPPFVEAMEEASESASTVAA